MNIQMPGKAGYLLANVLMFTGARQPESQAAATSGSLKELG